MISRLRVLGLDVSDGRAAFSRAKPARQEDALPTKANCRVVDTRARGLDDRLVSCTGLDRLPVDQAPGFLKSAPYKLLHPFLLLSARRQKDHHDCVSA